VVLELGVSRSSIGRKMEENLRDWTKGHGDSEIGPRQTPPLRPQQRRSYW